MMLQILGGAAFGMSVFGLIRYEVLGYSELFKSVTLATIIPWIGAISSTLAITMVPLCGCHGAVSQRKSQLVLVGAVLYIIWRAITIQVSHAMLLRNNWFVCCIRSNTTAC